MSDNNHNKIVLRMKHYNAGMPVGWCLHEAELL